MNTKQKRLEAIGVLLFLGLTLGCRGEAPSAAEPDSVAPPPATTSGSAPPVEASPNDSAAGGVHTNVAVIDIPNAQMSIPGILTGGQPTIEQFEAAAQAGYRTIVNLRAPGENGSWDEATKAAELGLAYLDIPIGGVDGLNVENARKLAAVVDDPQALPAMVHCASGNRVGGLFAVKALHIDGKDPESALAIGRETGLTKLEEAVKERLSSSK